MVMVGCSVRILVPVSGVEESRKVVVEEKWIEKHRSVRQSLQCVHLALKNFCANN